MSLSKISVSSTTATSRPSSPKASGTAGSQQAEGAQSTEATRTAGALPEGMPSSKRPSTSATDTSSPSLAPRRQASLPREQSESPATPLISSQASAPKLVAPGTATQAPAPTLSGTRATQILSGVIARFQSDIDALSGTAAEKSKQLGHLQVLAHRSSAQLERLSSNLEALYGHQRVQEVLGSLLEACIAGGLQRPDDLKALDAVREHDPNWFNSNKAIGSTLYVDRHCGNLGNLEKEIDGYFNLMNVTMLHLLPTIYKTPEKDNDGGYAISDFRSLNPAVGETEDLLKLFKTMRNNGISPIMDVTINHVADDHAWAVAAKAGDPEKLAYFFVMDEAEKNEYDRHMKPIFPDIRPGSFTKNEDIGNFVLTTFMSTQWDLNYSNPKTLSAMAGELLFLLNQGAEVLRMDAVPHMWKEKGTDCFGLPQTQGIIGVFNTMSKIAAPASILLSEAIDEPGNVKRYLGPDKCQLAYNTMTLTHLWDGLVHADASFMADTLKRNADIPEGTALLNMARTHDDAPFKFDPSSAEALGIDIKQRHKSLGDFYSGDGYAKALKFNASDKSGYVSICGTMGSLVGIEKAIDSRSKEQTDTAILRIKLLNSLLLSLPGVPMLNLTGGDDRGQINDYSFMKDEIQSQDNRWVHRVKRDVNFKKKSLLEIDVMGRVFSDTVELNRVRAWEMPAFGAGPIQVIETGKTSVLGFVRQHEEQDVMVLANFSPDAQKVDPRYLLEHGMTDTVTDKIGQQKVDTPKDEALKDEALKDGAQTSKVLKIRDGIELAPYQCMWLVPANREVPQPPATETAKA